MGESIPTQPYASNCRILARRPLPGASYCASRRQILESDRDLEANALPRGLGRGSEQRRGTESQAWHASSNGAGLRSRVPRASPRQATLPQKRLTLTVAQLAAIPLRLEPAGRPLCVPRLVSEPFALIAKAPIVPPAEFSE